MTTRPEQKTTANDKLECRIEHTGYHTRRMCCVCGGLTEKESVIVVFEYDERDVHLVCERCIASAEKFGHEEINSIIDQHVERLTAQAAFLPTLKGRLVLPNLQEVEDVKLVRDAHQALDHMRCNSDSAECPKLHMMVIAEIESALARKNTELLREALALEMELRYQPARSDDMEEIPF